MILEIRTYRLKPGTLDDFVRVMQSEGVPLLEKYGITVVASGASLTREDGFEEAYILRAFPSLEAREEQERAFYGSADWAEGPRDAVISRIETYHTITIETSPAAIDALSESGHAK